MNMHSSWTIKQLMPELVWWLSCTLTITLCDNNTDESP